MKGVRTAIVVTVFFALFPFPAHAESKKSTDYKNCIENVDLGADGSPLSKNRQKPRQTHMRKEKSSYVKHLN